MQINQVVVSAKEQVSLQSVELNPDDLEPGEFLIRTERTFISAGTELAIYCAVDADVYKEGSWCCYPWVAGYANVGRVIDAGEGGRHLVGKRVFTNGPHASVFRYKADGRYKMIVPVPEELALEQAAFARMAMVAMTAVDVSAPAYMRWVVVFGLGMVGNLAAQLFRLTGAHVIGVDTSPVRREMAARCGIPYVISGTEEEVFEQVSRLTGGVMAQVAVDAVGSSAVSLQAVRLAAQGGEVIILGSPRTAFQSDLTEVFRASHLRWVTIKGALEWCFPVESAVEHSYTLTRKLEGLFRWIADGRLVSGPLLTHTLPPDKIQVAYEGLLKEKDTYVGVILNWE